MGRAKSTEIDEYLAVLDEPHRTTLAALHATLREVLPQAREGMSYGAPVFMVDDKRVAGFSASRKHLTCLPHSGSLLAGLTCELEGYKVAKGSFQFPVDEPLPAALVQQLVEARLAELGLG